MALLKIARIGHPVLRTPAIKVDDPKSPEIVALARDMIETMYDANGTGLAAPQVHTSLRMVVFYIEGARVNYERSEAAGGHMANGSEDSGAIPLTVMINPEIEVLSDDVEAGWEGCLSVPGMVGEVARHAHIRYKWLDLDGNSHEREAKGFHARVVQHECDHLDGILYPSRIADMDKFGFNEEMIHGQQEVIEE